MAEKLQSTYDALEVGACINITSHRKLLDVIIYPCMDLK